MTFISGNKIILTAAFVCWLLMGCLPQRAILDPAMPVQQLPAGFFNKLPELIQIQVGGKKMPALTGADTNLLVAGFTERYIEKDNLLTYSILGEKSTYPVVTYDDIKVASQKLFIYHIRVLPEKVPAVVYLAAKYDENDTCVGVGPAYLGFIDDAEGHIDFLYSLSLKVKGKDTFLVADKKIVKLKKEAKQFRSSTKIVFLSDDLKKTDIETSEMYWARLATSGIAVSKIIEYNANKVGGRQPVIFNIHEIMKDEQYLQFLPITFNPDKP